MPQRVRLSVSSHRGQIEKPSKAASLRYKADRNPGGYKEDQDLTGDVVQAGHHAAPLEEGVRVGVHHQQFGHAAAGLDGGHHLRVRLSLHGHGVDLGMGFIFRRFLLRSPDPLVPVPTHRPTVLSRPLSGFHSSILSLGLPEAPRAGNPLYPRASARTHSFECV